MSEQDATPDEFVDGENQSNWSTEKLDFLLTELLTGNRPTGGGHDEGKYISIGGTQIDSGGYIDLHDLVYIPEEYFEKVSDTQLQRHDILMVKDGANTGDVAILWEDRPDIVTNEHVMTLRLRDDVNPPYIFYYLLSHEGWRQLKGTITGSAQEGINKSFAGKVEITYPSPEEQHKIASVLYTVDQAIQKTEEIIEQIDTVRKGLIQDLLTGEFNNEKEKTSRVGPKEVEIPNNWVVKTVSDISNIKNGNRIVKGHEYSDGTTDYPFIRIVDMENGTVSTEDINYLKEETAKQMQRGIISSDDVYITVTGRVGDAGTIPPELDGARFTDNAAKLYDLEGVIPEYLSLYLRSKFGQDEVHRFTVGSTQPKLSMYRVEKMEVIVPPIDEQEEIVTHVSSIDETRFQNAKIKGKLQRLKQGLMQDLLSGEVRTHDKEIELIEDVLQHG